jgi:dipeptidyl aminopeptidase/acylaminoacyl peptidase
VTAYSDIVKVWDAETGRELFTLSGYSAEFSPDGRRIVSMKDDTIKVWDAETGRELRTLAGHVDSVISVVFSPDGRRILSRSEDRIVKIWDAETGRELLTLSGDYAKFSPDGQRVILRDSDYTVKVRDAETGWELRTFSEYPMDISPDGRRFISRNDSSIKVWDTETGRELHALSGHSSWVHSAVFSPDGKTIISTSNDHTPRIWDAETGREIAQLIGFTDGEWIVLTPDGYYNASPRGDQYLNVRVGNNVYGIDQYRSTFYKPRVVEARLAGSPDPQNTDIAIQDVTSPPVVVIRSPENGTALGAAQTELSVSVVDQRQPVKNIRITVNGRLVGANELGQLTGSRGLSVANTGINVSGNENRGGLPFSPNVKPGNQPY